MFGMPTDHKGEDLDEFFVQAVLLSEVIKRLFKKKANLSLSRKPIFKLKMVTEFMGRMRISSFEKFDTTTYISTINFYRSVKEMEKEIPAGVIVLYIPEGCVLDLLGRMGYPVEAYEDDEEAMEDACGTLCNLVAGNFKSGLVELGYDELEMSHFTSFRNEILNGVDFCAKQMHKYEIHFEVRRERYMIADLNMGKIPKKKILSR